MKLAFVLSTIAMLALGPLAAAADTSTVAFPRLCGGGEAAGSACARDDDCGGGYCVRAAAVCDGGGADRFDCYCPGGACTQATVCGSDPDLGTCVGGAREGACCEPLLACENGAACVATARVCMSGAEKGFGCLRDAHCPRGTCSATTGVCRGGLHDGAMCIDAAECLGGACTGGSGAAGCIGDCDASGEVTVDELVTLVNMGLGSIGIAVCPAADGDGDGSVTVDEIIAAVNNGLSGCPAPPTPGS